MYIFCMHMLCIYSDNDKLLVFIITHREPACKFECDPINEFQCDPTNEFECDPTNEFKCDPTNEFECDPINVS